MSKIAVLIPDLRGGGAERVNLLLLNEFIKSGHDVDLLLLCKQGELLIEVPEQARIIDLRAGRIRKAFMPLARYLRARRPDALLVSMWPLTTLAILAAFFSRYRGCVVTVEHSALSLSPQNNGISGFVLRASMRWLNAYSDVVVGVSAGVIEDLKLLGLPTCLCRVIHNPIAISDTSEIPESWKEHPWVNCADSHRLLSVGSLKQAKDYPTLLHSVKMLVDSGCDVSLLILGNGPLQAQLEELCLAIGIDKHVHFGGFALDPGPFYRAADLFVLSSKWEGFGNVIVEALAAGTPVVSTDCKSGPSEILKNGEYGRLVPVGCPSALAKAIEESLLEPYDPEVLKARAKDFSPEIIAKRYLEFAQ